LSEVGINVERVTKTLENDGVKKFIKSFDKLMDALSKKSVEK
jgi:transaldolase